MMWNPKWRREGRDPDYRFSLANERTFLAWIRSALALLAGGVILEQLATRLGPPDSSSPSRRRWLRTHAFQASPPLNSFPSLLTSGAIVSIGVLP